MSQLRHQVSNETKSDHQEPIEQTPIFKDAIISNRPQFFGVEYAKAYIIAVVIAAIAICATYFLNLIIDDHVHAKIPHQESTTAIDTTGEQQPGVSSAISSLSDSFGPELTFGSAYTLIDPLFTIQEGNSLVVTETPAEQFMEDDKPRQPTLILTTPYSKIAFVQGPQIESGDDTTVTIVTDIANTKFWSTYSFYSHPLPNPLHLKFTAPEEEDIDDLSEWHPALALGESSKDIEPVIIDQIDRDHPDEFKLRFSLMRPKSHMSWDHGFASLSLPVMPASIVKTDDNRSPNVAIDTDRQQILNLSSLADFPVNSVTIGLVNLSHPEETEIPEWIPEHVQLESPPPFRLYLENGKDINKLLKYLSVSPEFSIEPSSFDRTGSGVFFMDGSDHVAGLYGKTPSTDEIKDLGKTLNASYAFVGKPTDFIAFPPSIRDRIRTVKQLFLQLETLWLIGNSRLIAVTADDLEKNPALVGSIIKDSQGLFIQPRPFISMNN